MTALGKFQHLNCIEHTSQHSLDDSEVFDVRVATLRDACIRIVKSYLRDEGIDSNDVKDWFAKFETSGSIWEMNSSGTVAMESQPILTRIVVHLFGNEAFEIEVNEEPDSLVKRLRHQVDYDRKVSDWIRHAKRVLSEKIVTTGASEEEALRFIDQYIQNFINEGNKVLEVDIRFWETKIAGEYRKYMFKRASSGR